VKTVRAERAMLWRCRRGDAEALSVLLYSLGDEIYTIAWLALGEEAAAGEATAAVWRRLLVVLARPWFNGQIRQRARVLAYREIGRRGSVRAARKALRQELAAAKAGDLRRVPEPLAQELLSELPGHAQLLKEKSTRRTRLKRTGLVLMVAGFSVGGFVLIGTYSRTLASATPALLFQTLQQEVAGRNLVAVLRDALEDLPDPEGRNQAEAQALEQAGLILEEIANAPDRGALDNMQYIRERVEKGNLTEELFFLADKI